MIDYGKIMEEANKRAEAIKVKDSRRRRIIFSCAPIVLFCVVSAALLPNILKRGDMTEGTAPGGVYGAAPLDGIDGDIYTGDVGLSAGGEEGTTEGDAAGAEKTNGYAPDTVIIATVSFANGSGQDYTAKSFADEESINAVLSILSMKTDTNTGHLCGGPLNGGMPGNSVQESGNVSVFSGISEQYVINLDYLNGETGRFKLFFKDDKLYINDVLSEFTQNEIENVRETLKKLLEFY